MDANKIVDNLLERIKQLTKENAFLLAQLQTIEEQNQRDNEAKSQDNSPVEVSEGQKVIHSA